MEPEKEGLVQMIFLFNWVIFRVPVPAVYFRGSRPWDTHTDIANSLKKPAFVFFGQRHFPSKFKSLSLQIKSMEVNGNHQMIILHSFTNFCKIFLGGACCWNDSSPRDLNIKDSTCLQKKDNWMPKESTHGRMRLLMSFNTFSGHQFRCFVLEHLTIYKKYITKNVRFLPECLFLHPWISSPYHRSYHHLFCGFLTIRSCHVDELFC